MKKKLTIKKLAPLLFLFLVMGCSSKEYYTLGDTSSIKQLTPYKGNIAIQKVDIPKYLKENAIIKQISPYKVVRLKNAHWLSPMEKQLTNVLINYLQKSMNNPNIYLYPWESPNKIEKKVSLKIKRFITYKNEVTLEASYKIDDLKNKTHKTKLFSCKTPTNTEIESMIEAMEKSYFKLITEINKDIIK